MRVTDADVGRKLGYTEQLDIISYFNLSQTNAQAALTASPSPAVPAEPEPTPVEDEVVEAIAKPKRPRRKSKALAKTAA